MCSSYLARTAGHLSASDALTAPGAARSGTKRTLAGSTPPTNTTRGVHAKTSMTDRVTIAGYRCRGCGRRIPARRTHVFAGVIVCCVEYAELEATHRTAYPDCPESHTVWNHRLVFAQNAADVERQAHAALTQLDPWFAPERLRNPSQ